MWSKVLILGGTGFVGRALCEALVERTGGGNGRIVVVTRQRARGKVVQFLPGVEVAQADIHEGAQLARLMAGCDAVVSLVAILHGSEAAFERVHVDLPRRIMSDMRAMGVRRLVHVSALGVPDGDAASAPSRYLRSKARGELVVRTAGLDATILRPSVIFGANDRFTNLFARMQSVLPLVPLAGAHSRFQPVWVGDVAHAIVRCLDDDATVGRTYECVGPREYTLAELVRLCGRTAGHERPVLPLPDGVARVQAALMELAPGDPLMSRDNLDSMRVPNVAGGKLPGLAQLGIEAASLEAVAPTYLGRTSGCARLDPLRIHARR
jgi:NADH dehydrogenase